MFGDSFISLCSSELRKLGKDDSPHAPTPHPHPHPTHPPTPTPTPTPHPPHKHSPLTRNAAKGQKGGRIYKFWQILTKNRDRNTTFSSILCSNIGVETIQIFQRPEKRGTKWRSMCSTLHSEYPPRYVDRKLQTRATQSHAKGAQTWSSLHLHTVPKYNWPWS